MQTTRSGGRRWRVAAAASGLVAGLVAIALWTMGASAAPTSPLAAGATVLVRTVSGTVAKTTPVTVAGIGGVPVGQPIDVDGTRILGILQPDIEVSVGLVYLDLAHPTSSPIVPSITIKRNVLALAANHPAPPLKIDLEINTVVGTTVFYGYETPAGAKTPTFVEAKLLGPPSGGFVDPLVAEINSPGHNGPLNLNITTQPTSNSATTGTEATFQAKFDSLPEKVDLTYDPRPDGLDVTYDHIAPVADVHLVASAVLKKRENQEKLTFGGEIERLPQHLEIHQTTTNNHDVIEYLSSSALNKPDVNATFRKIQGDGTVVADGSVQIAGLPFHLRGTIDSVDGAQGPEVDKVDFQVLDGEQVDTVDFTATNFDPDPMEVPEPKLEPEQFVTATTRRGTTGRTLWRTSGRLFDVRHLAFERSGSDNQTIDATVDMGDGIRPLQAIVDLDGRGAGAPADARRLKLDTTITPLPRLIHAIYAPSPANSSEPTRLTYDTGTVVDVEADVLVADGPNDACGQPKVTCAKARIDKLPSHMDVELPGQKGTDFRVSHSGAARPPDVRAIVDRTDEVASKRVWADVSLLRVPPEVRGRIKLSSGVLQQAEFHACIWNFGDDECDDNEDALGRVKFTVRDQPARVGLPARPETAEDYVTVLARDDTFAAGDEHFEAAGSVNEVRHVAFHQRDDDADGTPDGTLGVKVGLSVPGKSFDAVVDSHGFTTPEGDPTRNLGTNKTEARIHVDELPHLFSTCLRQASQPAPPSPGSLSADILLAQCDRTDVLGREPGQLDTTPLSVNYDADVKTKVDADIFLQGPDLENTTKPQIITRLKTTVDAVPARVRTDVIPPVEPSAGVEGRRFEMEYRAQDADEQPSGIDVVDLTSLELRRANSICGDPRPGREATCLAGHITDIPATMGASFDPDPARGDFAFTSSVPDSDQPRMAIHDLELSNVAAGDGSIPLLLKGDVLGITPRLSGRIVRKDVDGDGEAELAEASFSACNVPGSGDHCGTDPAFGSGIQQIDLTATNQLLGEDELLAEAIPAAPGGVSDEASFVLRGRFRDQPPNSEERREPAQFRARANLHGFREVLYSKLHPDSTDPIASRRITIGAGDAAAGDAIRTYFDSDNGTDRVIADAVMRQVPKTVAMCMRDPLLTGTSPDTGSPVWCDRQQATKGAIQIALPEPDDTRKPDIDLDRLLFQKASGSSVLQAQGAIDDLGDRIDMLLTKGNEPDVLVEGRKLGYDGQPLEGELADAAGRVTIEAQNYLNQDPTGNPEHPIDDSQLHPAGSTFPWAPAEPGVVDPESEAANQTAGKANFVKAMIDSVSRRQRFYVKASVPGIKRLGVQPGPCVEDATRFPSATDPHWPEDKIPTYQCVRATVGQGRPLGMVVRRLAPAPEDGRAQQTLAIEEGRIDKLPSGDGGLQATLATQPGKVDGDQHCGPDHMTLPCRPPLASLQADYPDDARATLTGRIFIGGIVPLEKVRAIAPDDLAASRLNYEENPRSWPAAAAGVRIKIGKGLGSGDDVANTEPGDETAVRIGAHMTIPRYLDLYPPSSFSCTHGARIGVPSDCDHFRVGAQYNHGYSASDTFVRIAGSDERPLGFDLPSIGRVAMFSQAFDDNNKQTVLTGAPKPDNKGVFNSKSEIITGADTSDARALPGGSSVNPENELRLPTGDPSLYGAVIPGYLDARIYSRDEYEATPDAISLFLPGKRQHSFVQVDGRTNRPMTVQLRVTDHKRPLKYNRGDQRVPGTSLVAYHLPGAAALPTGGKPTFRLRALLDSGFDDPTGLLNNFAKKLLMTAIGIGGLNSTPSPFSPTFNLPTDTEPGYKNIKLNADPALDAAGADGDQQSSAGAARTIDVAGGPFGAASDVDMVGWREVDGSGGDAAYDKGERAKFSFQAALRLSNFELGVGVKISFLGLLSMNLITQSDMDIVLGASGGPVSRARLKQFLLNLRLTDEGAGGDVGGLPAQRLRVDTDMLSQVQQRITTEALFGLIESPPIEFPLGLRQAQDLQFSPCEGGLGQRFFTNGVAANQLTPSGAAMSLGFPKAIVDPSSFQLGLLAIVTKIISPLGCALGFLDPYDRAPGRVSKNQPAPSFDIDGHRVPGRPVATETPLPQPPAPPPPAPPGDLTINSQRTMCGEVTVRRLTVTSTGWLMAGQQGSFDKRNPSDPTEPAIECDGGLSINATEIVVESGGRITADATRPPAAERPDSTSEGCLPGGGAGHNGYGGGFVGYSDSETRSQCGFPSPEPTCTDDVVECGPRYDFGSAGGDGQGMPPGSRPGNGGGALVISAKKSVQLDGLISAGGGFAFGNLNGRGTCAHFPGGGSGGAIDIVAPRVFGGGVILANGGDGDGNPINAIGGDGGAKGRVTIHRLTDDLPTGGIAAREGNGGRSDGACGPNGKDAGTPGLLNGVLTDPHEFYPDVPPQIDAPVDMSAGIELADQPGYDVQGGKIVPTRSGIKLNLGAVSNPADPRTVHVIVCYKRVSPSDPQGSNSGGLTPPGKDTAEPNDTLTGTDLILGADVGKKACRDYNLGHHDSWIYERTVTFDLPTDDVSGWVGLYAFAAHSAQGQWDHGFDLDCVDPKWTDKFIPLACDHQTRNLPQKPMAIIGVDPFSATPTNSQPRELSGNGDCGGHGILGGPEHGYVCTNDAYVKIAMPVADDFSGLARLECRILTQGEPLDSDPFPADDKPEDGSCGGPANANERTFAIGPKHGLKAVMYRSEDFVGNRKFWSTGDTVAFYFYDPIRPEVSASLDWHGQTAKNGWYAVKPGLNVGVHDPGPSSGFRADAVSVLVDGDAQSCDSAKVDAVEFSNGTYHPTADGATDATCDNTTLQELVPETGEHTFQVRVRDRAGNDSDIMALEARMKVDTVAAKTELFLGPARPDGKNDWYRTTPFVHFVTHDGVNGSGVDPGQDTDGTGTGVYWKLDPTAADLGDPRNRFTLFDVADVEHNLIPDGIHNVCWFSIDVAGNAESVRCRSAIRVDTTAPWADQAIAPIGPDGSNSWFRTKPTVTQTASDPAPISTSVPESQRSGLDRVEYQLDEGPWTSRAPVTVDEGEHTVRARAVDRAGNVSDVNPCVLSGITTDCPIRVDLSKPSSRIGLFPPRPNDYGWLRRGRVHSVSVIDGRPGSGSDSASFSLDGGPSASYLAPFTVFDGGARTFAVTGRDRAGNVAPTVTSISNIDTIPPVATPGTPASRLDLGLLNPTPIALPFTASDTAGKVKVQVVIFNELGQLQKRIDVPGTFAGGYRANGGGSVTWNGCVGNGPVEAGDYHYRVHAVDLAGNTIVSTESRPILILRIPFLTPSCVGT